jgi:hypothetical protein
VQRALRPGVTAPTPGGQLQRPTASGISNFNSNSVAKRRRLPPPAVKSAQDEYR